MKKAKTKKREVDRMENDFFLMFDEWSTIEDYSEEEIEDMIEEYHIPDISYIDMIERPEEIRFD